MFANSINPTDLGNLDSKADFQNMVSRNIVDMQEEPLGHFVKLPIEFTGLTEPALVAAADAVDDEPSSVPESLLLLRTENHPEGHC